MKISAWLIITQNGVQLPGPLPIWWPRRSGRPAASYKHGGPVRIRGGLPGSFINEGVDRDGLGDLPGLMHRVAWFDSRAVYQETRERRRKRQTGSSRLWWNWKTREPETLVPSRRGGSNPPSRTTTGLGVESDPPVLETGDARCKSGNPDQNFSVIHSRTSVV